MASNGFNGNDITEEQIRLIREYIRERKRGTALDRRSVSMAEEIDKQLKSQSGAYYELSQASSEARDELNKIVADYGLYGDVLNEIQDALTGVAKDTKISGDKVVEMAKAFEELEKAKRAFNEYNSTETNDNLKRAEIKWDKYINSNDVRERAAASRISKNSDKFEEKLRLQRELNNETSRASEKLSRYNDELEISNKRLENHHKRWDVIVDIIESAYDTIKEVGRYWMDVQDRSFKTARQMGLSRSQAAAMTKAQLEMTKELAFEYGVTQEQLMKFQETYTQQTGKAIQLTKDEIEGMTVMSKLGDDQQASTWASEMAKYGKGIEETAGEFVLIQSKAKALGLNASNATATIAKNLHLANSYTFRGGSDGIAKMALKAQSLRVDMEKVMLAVDKFQDIQSSIETSANLQMLGGGFAAEFSNPMAALYEGYNDPEAIMDRVVRSVAGYATYNKKSGEAEISGLGNQLIKAAAQSLGVDRETLQQIAKSQVIGKEIEGAMGANANSLSDEYLTQVKNLAHRNKNHEWVVTNYDEEGREDGEIKVNEITARDLDRISDVKPEEKDMYKDVHNIDANVAALARGVSRAKGSVTAKEQLHGAKEGLSASAADLMHNVFEGIADQANNGLFHSIVANVIGNGAIAAGVLLGAKGLGKIKNTLGFGSIREGARTIMGRMRSSNRRNAARAAGFGGVGGGSSSGSGGGSSSGRGSRMRSKISNAFRSAGNAIGKVWKSGKLGKAGLITAGIAAVGATGYALLGGNGKEEGAAARGQMPLPQETMGGGGVLSELQKHTVLLEKIAGVSAEDAVFTDDGAKGAVHKGALEGTFIGGVKSVADTTTSAVSVLGPSIGKLAAKPSVAKAVGATAAKGMVKVGCLAAKANPMGLAGLAVDVVNVGGKALGAWEEGGNVDKGMNVLSDTATGAGLGAMIGGPVGAVVGGAIGGIYGVVDQYGKDIVGYFKKKRAEAKKDEDVKAASAKFKGAEIGASSLDDPRLMQKAALATISIHDILAEKYQRENGLKSDGTKKSLWERTKDALNVFSTGGIVSERAAAGRIVGGDSYVGDTVPVLANSGEMILNKPEQDRLFSILSSYNVAPGMANGGYGSNGMVVSKPYTGKETIMSNRGGTNAFMPQIGPMSINLNVGGSIKLDLGGNMMNIDAGKLLGNSAFKRQLTDMISRQLNIIGNGGKFNKEGSAVNTQKMFNAIR